MAIPKVCGIENEYGFVILDEKGRQVGFDSNDGDDDLEDELDGRDSEYKELTEFFVKNFLESKTIIHYDQSKETPTKGIFDKRPKLSLKEILHRLLVKKLSKGRCDGFLQNGARFYLDGHHPEYSTPECLNPLDLVAHDKVSELVMMEAQRSFKERCPKKDKYRIIIHKNNSDGFGLSYGCHLNVLMDVKMIIDPDSFRYLVRKYLPFQIARMILIGGGKFGAENDCPPCRFQISQRADFFETPIGVATTSQRPIFNTRNEPHADPGRFYRLHDISTDSLMCEQAIFLKVALAQIVLAMIEDRFLEEDWFPQNPTEAMIMASRDLKFKNPIKLKNGKKATGMEILRYYLSKGKEYLNQKPLGAQHKAAIDQAFELLDLLERDWRLTFGKLDWTTALGIMEKRPASAKRNILKFRKISPGGLYYRLLESGKISRLVDDAIILKAGIEAPTNTRAYLREFLIKKFGSRIEDMSWSVVRININSAIKRFDLGNPVLDKVEYAALLSELIS